MKNGRLCLICKNEMQLSHTEIVENVKEKTIIVDNVPSYECSNEHERVVTIPREFITAVKLLVIRFSLEILDKNNHKRVKLILFSDVVNELVEYLNGNLEKCNGLINKLERMTLDELIDNKYVMDEAIKICDNEIKWFFRDTKEKSNIYVVVPVVYK